MGFLRIIMKVIRCSGRAASNYWTSRKLLCWLEVILNYSRYTRGIGSDYIYGISFLVNIRTSSDGGEVRQYPSPVQSKSLWDFYHAARMVWLSTVLTYLCRITIVIGCKTLEVSSYLHYQKQELDRADSLISLSWALFGNGLWWNKVNVWSGAVHGWTRFTPLWRLTSLINAIGGRIKRFSMNIHPYRGIPGDLYTQ